MTITGLIADNPAGRAAKQISDYLYLDNKEAKAVYETLTKFWHEAFALGVDVGLKSDASSLNSKEGNHDQE